MITYIVYRGRIVPTLDRTFVVNFVNSTALSGNPNSTNCYSPRCIYTAIVYCYTPQLLNPVEPDVPERFITPISRL